MKVLKEVKKPRDPKDFISGIMTQQEAYDLIPFVYAHDQASLYKQFPDATEQMEAWVDSMRIVAGRAKATLEKILKQKKYQHFVRHALSHGTAIGKNINDVLMHPTRQAFQLWSFNPGNNRSIGLFYTSDLEVVIGQTQFHYMSEHSESLHWIEYDAGREKGALPLVPDSVHLFQACHSLSSAPSAQKYLHARIALYHAGFNTALPE